jgi:hypothetical protein
VDADYISKPLNASHCEQSEVLVEIYTKPTRLEKELL